MKCNNTPSIRFAGFTDAWEQRNFGDVFVERREKSEVENEDTLLSCAISGMYLNSELFSHQRGQSNIGYIKVKKGDLILSAQNLHLGNANVNLRFNHGIISPAYKVYELINCDASFAQAWVKQEKTKDYFLSATTEGASVCRKNVVWEWLYNQPFTIPNIKEQLKIGSFFRSLDTLITLHQRKYDQLVNIKKSMLDKMFPKNGETVPEVRFAGFTDAWEQRRLGEHGNLKNGMNFTKEAMGVGFPFVNLQNIFGRTVIECEDLGKAMASSIQLKEYNLRAGDVLFVRSSVKLEGVGEAALVPKTLENTTYSGFIIRFRDEYGLADNFKRFVFCTDLIREQIMAQATDSANKNISQSVLSNLTLYIPCKDEQEQIGAFLERLDDLITLHQREFSHTKPNTNYVKYYQRNRPLLYILCTVDKSV